MARESQQDLDSSGIRRRRKPRETSPSRASETTPQTSQINNVAPPFYVNRLLSPEASSNQSMSPSYSASSTSFPSPLSDPPVYGGCSCHGLVHCPISQPYVSTRKQSLPFFDLVHVHLPHACRSDINIRNSCQLQDILNSSNFRTLLSMVVQPLEDGPST